MSEEKYYIKKSTLEGIADAIRTKDDTSEDISVSNFRPRILAIPSEQNNISIVTITNNLLHCTTTNIATSIITGAEYRATITPDFNYVISTVQIKMNDIDITTDVWRDGNINISKVVGDIEININSEIDWDNGFVIYQKDLYNGGPSSAIENMPAFLSTNDRVCFPPLNTEIKINSDFQYTISVVWTDGATPVQLGVQMCTEIVQYYLNNKESFMKSSYVKDSGWQNAPYTFIPPSSYGGYSMDFIWLVFKTGNIKIIDKIIITRRSIN